MFAVPTIGTEPFEWRAVGNIDGRMMLEGRMLAP
jgi:hypothetical protein